MTEQELREKLFKEIPQYIRAGGSWAISMNKLIDNTLNAFKEAGYVKLAEDQSLPSVRNAVNKSYNDYMLGQEDMLKAGWQKVEVDNAS